MRRPAEISSRFELHSTSCGADGTHDPISFVLLRSINSIESLLVISHHCSLELCGTLTSTKSLPAKALSLIHATRLHKMERNQVGFGECERQERSS
ncbi:hypothetical protein QQP08_026251 [Theobroma cacao]|nr:hypothetical protein QQP08_026251 [Theobroma cacao]